MSHKSPFHPVARAALVAMLYGVSLGAMAQTAPAPGTAPGTAHGTAGTPAAATHASTLSRSDQSFVEKAAHGGMAEVEMGRIAQKSATNPQVRAFAERMVQDHSKATEELMQIAAAKGMKLPTGLDRSQTKDAEKMSKMTGAGFDRAYMEHMVADHKKDVAEFQKASRSADDAQIKAFAARTLPTLQDHLQQAQTTYAVVKDARVVSSSERAAPR